MYIGRIRVAKFHIKDTKANENNRGNFTTVRRHMVEFVFNTPLHFGAWPYVRSREHILVKGGKEHNEPQHFILGQFLS